MITVFLDYGPGLHGHFLEYIVNRYIYRTTDEDIKVFQRSGAAHDIEKDRAYQDGRMVFSAHYSYFNQSYPGDIEQVIFIPRDPDYDFVLLTNIVNRCFYPARLDLTTEEINAYHLEYLDAASDVEKRNDWYTKLLEQHLKHYDTQQDTNLPTFNFKFSSLFNLGGLIDELNRLANFLNQRFVFEQSFVELWYSFIAQNQGWFKYEQGIKLLNSILENHNQIVVDDWQIHAYLNYRLSKMFQIYDGQLFEGAYPRYTSDIRQIVNSHISNFDRRFS